MDYGKTLLEAGKFDRLSLVANGITVTMVNVRVSVPRHPAERGKLRLDDAAGNHAYVDPSLIIRLRDLDKPYSPAVYFGTSL